MQRRVISVWLPMWSIDLLRRRQRTPASAPAERRAAPRQGHAQPARTAHPPAAAATAGRAQAQPKSAVSNPTFILLVTTSGNRQTIAHGCEAARAAGVTPGMSLAHARALLPADRVVLEECRPARDRQRLEALASWAMRFSPIVAPDAPDGLLLDVTGCQRVHQGERRLVNAIANSLDWLGFRAQVACASTFACAWAMARYAACARASHRLAGDRDSGESKLGAPHGRFIVESGAELEALRPLPIEALRLEQEVIDALHEVNIDLVGHLTSLPRNDLAARFGRDLLRRLDQAAGHALESLTPLRPIEALRVERAFDGPVKQVEGIALSVEAQPAWRSDAATW